MSSNVTKTDRHGSGVPRPPKTSLGCKSSILAIRDRSGPDERRLFFSKAALPSPDVEQCDQNRSVGIRVL